MKRIVMFGISHIYGGGIDPELRRRHGWLNRAQSVLLLGGMLVLLALCGWLIGGPLGLLWLIAIGGIGLLIATRVSPRMVLAMFRAQPLSRRDLPEIHAIVADLSRRAGLPRAPELYFVGSRTMNAFSVGDREDGAIAMTGGLLRGLNLRELAGVLAHEISHLDNGDTRVMALADVMARLTRVMSLIGIGLLLLNLPFVMTDEVYVSWPLVALLIFAPTIVALLQLALSRTREYDADLDAAALTGDPVGLAQALARLERYQGALWEDILMPGRRAPDPSILRTHPTTQDRVKRLLDLRPEPTLPQLQFPRELTRHHGAVPTVHRQPRWHRSGLWY